MGIYLSPARSLRLRWGLGWRWLRLPGGDGAPGISSGVGPVLVDRPLRRRRRRW
jgi:hypothetical protein